MDVDHHSLDAELARHGQVGLEARRGLVEPALEQVEPAQVDAGDRLSHPIIGRLGQRQVALHLLTGAGKLAEVEQQVAEITGRDRLAATVADRRAQLAVTLVCEGMSLYAFRTNTPVLLFGIAATGLTLGFLAYGIQLFRRLTNLEVADESLVDRIRHRLEFFDKHYEIWLWMLALSFVFLNLSVSTLVDVEDGHYRINRPWFVAGLLVTQFLLCYGALKLSHLRGLRHTRAVLSDLQNQVLSGTEEIERQKRTWRMWHLVALVVLTATAVWGLVKAMGW